MAPRADRSMQVNVQKLSPVLVEFDVQVDVDRVKTELEKAYQSIAKNAKIRGFRPGKAPRRVLTQLFGDRIASDVAQRLVDETFPQAVSQQNLQPLTSPSIERQKLVDSEPFSYKARFEVLPQIESVEYEGLPAKRPKAEVTDAEVEEQLLNLRKSHATLEPLKESRPAAKGDVLSIDFRIEVVGREIRDAGAQDFQVELGGGTLISAIEEALIGKSTGDTVSAEVDMPPQHPHPKLKGKRATFIVTVKDQKQRVIPEADDEFAKDLGEYDTLEDLTKHVRGELEKQLKEQLENAVAEQLVRALADRNPVPLPPSLVEQQARMTEQDILTRARSQGQRATGVGQELRDQIMRDSEIKVRAGLLMAEIAKREGIKIGDPEIEEGLKELAEQTGKNIAKLRVEYRDQKKREMLLGMILENKVLDIIEAKAKIEQE
jgi:trigger factor